MINRFSNWMNGLFERAQAIREGREELLPAGESDSQAPTLPDALSSETRAEVDALWERATRAHAEQDWAATEAAARAILELEDTDEGWHLLAVVLVFLERVDEAQALFEELVQRQPGSAEARHDLANVCRLRGDVKRAKALYTQAIQLAGQHAGASRSLGQMLLETGQNEAAAQAFDELISMGAASAADHCAHGIALLRAGNAPLAREAFSSALAADPDDVQAHSGLADILRARGQLDEAIAHYRKAAELRPDSAGLLNELGATLIMTRRFHEAVDVLSLSVALKPQVPGPRLNLATATLSCGNAVDAIEQLQEVLAARPDDTDVLNNLGNAERDLGNIDQAVACFRKAVEVKPDSSKLHSNLLLTLLYDPRLGNEQILAEHQVFGERHGGKSDTAPAAVRERSNGERLRIAYMSTDFRRHPVGQYILGVLSAHDRDAFEVFCYADVARTDVMTERCRDAAEHWISTVGMDDPTLAARVAEDQIDILIDLGGHTAQNRLRVLAARPAPLQCSWIGYVGSTGLSEVDYVLADEVAVPADVGPQFTERVAHIAGGYLCYAKPEELPELGLAPCLTNGHVTFGCFSTLAKISSPTLRSWSRLLERIPDARLLLQRTPYADERVREVFLERAASHGMDVERIDFAGGLPYEAFLRSYGSIDVMLDTTPFSGGSTTAEALWMGVPVLTLTGERFGSRTSASLLAAAGLHSLITSSEDQYVERALELASDPQRLADDRATIREAMHNSNAGNPAMLTARLEQRLQQIWAEHRAN